MSESSTGQRGRSASPVDDADRAVLALVIAGQLDALQELYDRYRVMAYSIAYRITTDASLAEDVVQDAFLGVWRNASRYVEGRGSVKTWLLSIVHHRAVDAVRRRRPTIDLPDREDIPPAGLTLPDLGPDVSAGRDRVAGRPSVAGRPGGGLVQAWAAELRGYGPARYSPVRTVSGAGRHRTGYAMRAAVYPWI